MLGLLFSFTGYKNHLLCQCSATCGPSWPQEGRSDKEVANQNACLILFRLLLVEKSLILYLTAYCTTILQYLLSAHAGTAPTPFFAKSTHNFLAIFKHDGFDVMSSQRSATLLANQN